MRKTSLIFTIVLLAAGCSAGGDRPKAEYDKATGHLQRLEFDANKDGRNDSVAIMDGARLIRIELDLTQNGKVDRWDFYNEDRTIEKVGFSSMDDGVMDSVAYYAAPHGALSRIAISTRRDGRFNRVEFYVDNRLDRSEEDTDGDGRVDKWETYRAQPAHAANEPAYAIATSAFDDSGRGTPTRRLVYGADGTILRVETDAIEDGHVAASEAPAIDAGARGRGTRAR